MANCGKIKILIVDDSPFVRKALTRIFLDEDEFEIAGTARDGKEALKGLVEHKPDVVTLDVLMPYMDGIEVLKSIMEIRPVPVLMLSQLTSEGAELTIKALELGAMDFVDKSAAAIMDFYSLADEIKRKVRAMAGGKPKRIQTATSVSRVYEPSGLYELVVIGASTGGPPALQSILQRFPAEAAFGVVIVQHMPQGFTATLASRLDSICEVRIKEAEDEEPVTKGKVLIAPSGVHTTIVRSDGLRVALDKGSSQDIHKPSIDRLFESASLLKPKRTIGVLLTGMGSDGARGLKKLRDRGALTIAQDKASSVIYGMPKVAAEMGGAIRVLGLTEIPDEILNEA